MARHLAPFSWRQRMAESVRRRSFGCVLPLGRHASTNGSKLIHCASDTIALSSFQKEQNARHHKQFKGEQALGRASKPTGEVQGTSEFEADEEIGTKEGHTLYKMILGLAVKHYGYDPTKEGADMPSTKISRD